MKIKFNFNRKIHGHSLTLAGLLAFALLGSEVRGAVSSMLAKDAADSTAHKSPKHESELTWSHSVPGNVKKVDHSRWEEFLQKYVDTSDASGIHLVRYGQVSKADKAALESYLQALQKIEVTGLNRSEQMAFWINLYNAKTLAIVLQNYPLASIRDIRLSNNVIANGPWDSPVLEVEKQKLSLNDIEHHILRPLWKDPRVHFALNCASMGCPDLAVSAFTSENLETLLDRGARAFINAPRGLAWKGEQLLLSSIFNWYGSDFGSNQRELLLTLAQWIPPLSKKKLEEYHGKINYQYDWKLNESQSKIKKAKS